MAGFGSHHVARHAIYARAPSEIRQLVLDHLSPPPCPPRPWRSRSYAHAWFARKLLPQPEPEVDGIDEDELGDGVQRQQSTTKRFTKRRTLSSLQPLVFTPIFPKNLLPPPETDIELKDQGPPHGAEPSTSRVHSTSLSLANLPSNTTKALLRPRFIKYGKIENIWVDEEGRTATITFVDARSVTTVLKENASRPLMMSGQELILWRKVSASVPTPVPIPPISSQQSPQPPSSTTGSSSPSLRPSPQASSSSNQDFDQDDFSMFPDEELDTNRTNFQRNDHDRGRGVLYVRNLHRWTTLRELRETFIAYGTIVAIRHKEQSNHAHILFHQKHHIYRTLELTKNNPLVLRDRRLILEASPDVPDILELERDTLWHTSLDDPFVGSSSPSPYRVLAIRAASEAAKAIRNQVQSPPSCTLFAGKLPIGVRPAKLARLFTRLGPLVDLRIAAHRRYALLEYPTVDAAVFALQEAINAQVRYGHMLPELDFASDNRTSRRSRTIYVNNWPAIDGERRVPNKEEQKEVARQRQKKARKVRRAELKGRVAGREAERVAKENELVRRAMERKWAQETMANVRLAEAEGLLILPSGEGVVVDAHTESREVDAVTTAKMTENELSQSQVEVKGLELSDYQEGVVAQPKKSKSKSKSKSKRSSSSPPAEDVEPYSPAHLRTVFEAQNGLQAVIMMPQYGQSRTRPAFVVFEDRPQAEKALKALQGASLPSAAPGVPATELELTMSELPYFGPIDLADLLGDGVQGEFDKLGEWKEWDEVRTTSRVMDWEEARQLRIERDDDDEDEGENVRGAPTRRVDPSPEAESNGKKWPFGLRSDPPFSVHTAASDPPRRRGFGLKS